MDKVFAENEGLVKKVASRFAFSRNVDFDEAYAEAALAFVTYYPNFDPALGALSTYMWRVMWGSLQKWHNLMNKKPHAEFIDEEYASYDKKFEMEKLSEVAAIAVDMAVGELTDLVEVENYTPTRMRVAIRKTLRELGYPIRVINKAFEDIQAAL